MPNNNIMETEATTSLGRNDICYCGSGKKYKRCCIDVKEKQAKEKEFSDQQKREAWQIARSIVWVWSVAMLCMLLWYQYS